jgi:hypothetical protein
MVSPRTIMSATRTGVYGTLAALFSINDPHTLQLLDAALIGGVLGDFSTWAMRSLIRLPSEIWHGAYDGAVNLVFGAFLYQRCQGDLVLRSNDFLLAVAAFIIVGVSKLVFYIAVFVREENED